MSNAATHDPGFVPGHENRPAIGPAVARASRPSNAMLEADLRALVRQLQLRQTDLESENKELRQQTTVAGVPSVEGEDAFDAVPVGYFILDRQGNVLKVNRAGCALLGGDRADLLAKPLKSFLVSDEHFTFETCLNQLVCGEASKWAGTFTVLKDEEPVHVAVVAGTGGSPEQAITTWSMVMVDVNDCTELEKALGESEMLYRSMVENVNIGITFIDTKHTIVKTNRAQRRCSPRTATCSAGRNASRSTRSGR